MRFLAFISLLGFCVGHRTVIIGDSMFWSGPLFFGGQPSPLSKWLEIWSGHSIENHALVGASLEDGWVKSIREQYQDVDKQPNITTLIMDGGGNDVMSHKKDCQEMNDKCIGMMNNSLSIAQSILEDVYRDGISNVIYLGFYYLQGLEEAANYADPKMKIICEHAKVDCHFVDPRFNSTTNTGLDTSVMLGNDQIHPNDEGYKVLAEMIWKVVLDFQIII